MTPTDRVTVTHRSSRDCSNSRIALTAILTLLLSAVGVPALGQVGDLYVAPSVSPPPSQVYGAEDATTNGATLRFGGTLEKPQGTLCSDCSVVAAWLRQIDSGGSPLIGKDIPVSVSNVGGTLSGAYSGNYDSAASRVQLVVTAQDGAGSVATASSPAPGGPVDNTRPQVASPHTSTRDTIEIPLTERVAVPGAKMTPADWRVDGHRTLDADLHPLPAGGDRIVLTVDPKLGFNEETHVTYWPLTPNSRAVDRVGLTLANGTFLAEDGIWPTPFIEEISGQAKQAELFFTDDTTPDLTVSGLEGASDVWIYEDVNDNEEIDYGTDVQLAYYRLDPGEGPTLVLTSASLGSAERDLTILTRAMDARGNLGPTAVDYLVIDFTPQLDVEFAPEELAALAPLYNLPSPASETDLGSAIDDETVVLGYADLVQIYGQTDAVDAFGGMYMSYEVGEAFVNVGFTREMGQHAEAVRALVPDQDKVRFFDTDYSLSELRALQETISEDTNDLATLGTEIAGVGVNQTNNRVLVEVVDLNELDEINLYTRYDPLMLELENAAPYGSTDRSKDPLPMKAGLRIASSGMGSGGCSSGFMAARDGDDKNSGLFTAGHCIVHAPQKPDYWYHATRGLGPGVYSKFSGDTDGGVVDIQNQEKKQASNQVFIGGWFSRVVKGVKPEGTFKAQQPICISVWLTGYKCGKILDPSFTLTLPEYGVTLKDQVKYNIGTQKGDSGGAVFRTIGDQKAEAYGIQSAARSDKPLSAFHASSTCPTPLAMACKDELRSNVLRGVPL